MAKLTIVEVLLAYEVPLVVLAVAPAEKVFVGVNYGDGQQSHLFYFARVQPQDLSQLYQSRNDVRYLVTRLKLGKYEFGETWGEAGDVVVTRAADSVRTEWLPRPGMFLSHPTSAAQSAELRTVHIDGRWGIDDLRRFSDLVQDCYAFVFALSGFGPATAKQSIAGLFRRYPWRGGFSSVNFFDDLYRLIPAPERAEVRSIQYASPGTIELRMNGAVADSIRQLVDGLGEEKSRASTAYTDVRAWLRSRGWLGKAKEDLRLTDSDNDELRERFKLLCSVLGLSTREDNILTLASSDPLGAVKILLAYYRRLAGLADYVATGKAQDVFAKA